MTDEKKLKDELITDEQANEAAGGLGFAPGYKCEGGCNKSYDGRIPHMVGSKPYCANCYAKYMNSHPQIIYR